jgi:tetratricopeptide (TPR) repeat protein
MRFLKLGATALAGVFLAAGAMAPVAMAQPVAQVSKAMANAFNEANAAIAAKDWATAKAKLDLAMTQTKTPQEKLAVEQTRVQVFANAQDWAGLITAVKAIETLNLLPAPDMKTYRAVIGESYKKLNDMPNYIKSQVAYLNQYGGSHQEFAVLAQDALNAKDTATSLIFVEKAIAASKTGGAKTPEPYYRIKARATQESGNAAGVYLVLEEMITDYPKEEYWAQLIGRAQSEAGYGPIVHLDIFRALQAAGVKLTAQQISFAANTAIDRGLPNEALMLLESPGAPSGEQDVKNLETARTQTPKDKASLAAETASVLAKGDASVIAAIGEAHLTYGDYPKAIEVLQAALAKGIPDAGEADAARLHLGIAQMQAGDKDAARTTWASVKTNNSVAALAQSWILISKVK